MFCSKLKSKLLSFQEFDINTSDAWEEDENDAIRVARDKKVVKAEEPRIRTISGGEVRSGFDVEVEFSSDRKKLPEQLFVAKKEEKDHKTSRPSPLSLLSMYNRMQVNL